MLRPRPQTSDISAAIRLFPTDGDGLPAPQWLSQFLPPLVVLVLGCARHVCVIPWDPVWLETLPTLPAGSCQGPSPAGKALITHPEATQCILMALPQLSKSGLGGGIRIRPVATNPFTRSFSL